VADGNGRSALRGLAAALVFTAVGGAGGYAAAHPDWVAARLSAPRANSGSAVPLESPPDAPELRPTVQASAPKAPAAPATSNARPISQPRGATHPAPPLIRSLSSEPIVHSLRAERPVPAAPPPTEVDEAKATDALVSAQLEASLRR
jgi:hypothetical protein